MHRGNVQYIRESWVEPLKIVDSSHREENGQNQRYQERQTVREFHYMHHQHSTTAEALLHLPHGLMETMSFSVLHTTPPPLPIPPRPLPLQNYLLRNIPSITLGGRETVRQELQSKIPHLVQRCVLYSREDWPYGLHTSRPSLPHE